MGRLDGRIAIVTGSTRGLGHAIAKAFVREGASVVVSGRGETAAREVAAQLDADGTRTLAFACDVSDLDSVRRLAARTIERFGRFDIWVNNAGLSAPYGPTGLVPPERFAAVLNTNIVGTYYGTHTALEHFLPARRGKIVNILGRGDTGPVALQNAYSTSKYWLKAFTQTVAKEHRDAGVGVFGYNPGLMTTDFLTHAEAIEGFESQMGALTTIVRMWGNPPEVPAEEIVRLASSDTDGKTGLIRSQLHAGALLSGALREGLRRLLGRKAPAFELDVKVVKPAIGTRGAAPTM